MYHRRNICNRKPCTHDNDGYRTSVTATGKHSFHPLLLRRALSLPVARCAIPSAPFSFSPLHVCLRFHSAFKTASACHFRCWGKGKDGIRNTNFLSKNLHALSGVVFCRKNLLILLPNLWEAPETKTTDAVEDGTRKLRTYGETKRKRTRPAPPNPNETSNNLKKWKIW